MPPLVVWALSVSSSAPAPFAAGRTVAVAPLSLGQAVLPSEVGQVARVIARR